MVEIHQKYMSMVLEMAEDNIDGGNGGPFAAMVVKDGEIIGIGVNSVAKSNDPTAHAEINAIREACSAIGDFQLAGCDIYTSCEPCPMCLGAIYWARPRFIYYAAQRQDAANVGFDDEFIYREIHIEPDKREIPAVQLRRDEAVRILHKWKEIDSGIRY